MGQRVYVLSLNEYSDILGIFTTIRQCRKFIEKLKDTNGEMHINVGNGVLLLHEIRLNEPENGRKNITKLLDESIKENKLKENKLKENKLKENKLKENKLKENKLKENLEKTENSDKAN